MKVTMKNHNSLSWSLGLLKFARYRNIFCSKHFLTFSYEQMNEYLYDFGFGILPPKLLVDKYKLRAPEKFIREITKSIATSMGIVLSEYSLQGKKSSRSLQENKKLPIEIYEAIGGNVGFNFS